MRALALSLYPARDEKDEGSSKRRPSPRLDFPGANEARSMRFVLRFVVLSLLVIPVQAADTPAPEVTLKGEVVDMHCYVTRGAKGKEHASCGNACLARGVAAGLLAEDGRLFVLLEEKPVSVKDRLAGLVGETVTVKGRAVERDGVRALSMTSVERTAATPERK
jgi:hypothetical protein